MQNQTCIVTGANGFVGRHLLPLLAERGFSYKACVKSAKNSFDFETGDLSTFNDWQTLFAGADVVIHLAAKVHDMRSPDLSEYMHFNRDLTKKMAIEAKKAGLSRFIFLSSVKVNGEFTLDKPFEADTLPHPEDPYGQSKFAAEKELLSLHEPGKFEVVIIRPPLVYGPGVKANFASLLRLIQRRIPLPFSSVQNKRSYVSVYNLIDLIVFCIRHPAAAGNVFLVSDDDDVSLPTLIRNVSHSLGLRSLLFPLPMWILKIITLPKKQIRLRLFSNLQVDISKTKKLLGWRPPYSMLASLKKMNSTD